MCILSIWRCNSAGTLHCLRSKPATFPGGKSCGYLYRVIWWDINKYEYHRFFYDYVGSGSSGHCSGCQPDKCTLFSPVRVWWRRLFSAYGIINRGYFNTVASYEIASKMAMYIWNRSCSLWRIQLV